MSERGSVVRGCATIVGLLLTGVLALVVWTAIRLQPESQPDVAKAAQSATARAADQQLTTRVDGQITRIRAALPWATYLGTTVADVCSTDWAHTGWMTRQTWTPVTCTRTSTVYEAFDGDFKQRLAEADAALAAADWQPQWLGTPTVRGDKPGLVAALDYAHEPPGDPNPSQLAEAAARPNRVEVRYGVPISSSIVAPAGMIADRPVQGAIEVTQAPDLPSFIDDGTAAHDIALKYPSVKTSYYVDWQPFGHDQVAAAYPAHGAVIAISIKASYNTAPPAS